MEPDGRLIIVYREGPPHIITPSKTAFSFREMERWKVAAYGIVIYRENEAFIIPWTSIRDVTIVFNSKEYVDKNPSYPKAVSRLKKGNLRKGCKLRRVDY